MSAARVREALSDHPRHRALAGVVAGLLLASASPLALFVAALAAAAVVGLACRRPLPALAMVLAVLAGGAVGGTRLASLEGGALPRLVGRPMTARATLLEPVRERSHGPAVVRVRLDGGPAAGEQAVLRLPPWLHGAAWPQTGAIVRVRGAVAALGRFDAYQRRRGAFAAVDAEALRATGERRGGAAGALDAIRRRAERAIDHGLDPPAAALLRGMVLGQDERLTDDVRDDFQASGLAHILAVSGQNVMLLATLVLAFGAVTGMGLRGRLALALAMIALYVPLAGAGPSIQRAGVMGAAGLVATLAGRPASRWYAVGLAAAVTLAVNPLAVGDPGWQLSFAAVVALLALGPPLRGALTRAMPGPLADALAITIAATVGTAPLMAFHFGQVSLVALPANVVAAPAVAPAMWLGMLATAAAQIAPALATPFHALNAPLLAFVQHVAHVAAAAPGAVSPIRLGSPAGVALAYAALAALLLTIRAAARRLPAVAPVPTARPSWHHHALAAVLAALAVTGAGVAWARGRPAPPAPGELVVTFLDVGQGDATLLQLDGATVLFDTGPPDGPILARLAQAGVDRLDALVLTHAEADHEGAALPIIERHRPRLVLNGGAGWPSPVQRALPGAVRAAGGTLTAARAGQSLALGRLRLRLLWPPTPPAGWRPDGSANGRAVVALASVGAFDLLLPADAESDVTLALDLPPVEALKVAHHGSADEGLELLLRRLHPAIAAIEVGSGNTYGHPTPDTLAALRGVPNVVRTDRDGTVRLHVRGGAMTLERR